MTYELIQDQGLALVHIRDSNVQGEPVTQVLANRLITAPLRPQVDQVEL